MKTFICVTTILLGVFVVGASSVRSQTQVVEGYTFVRGATGPLVCLGRWVPSRDVALPGVCEGQEVDVAQLTAISARLSADRLDQVLIALASIDQRLALSNDQFRLLIEATVNTQTSIDRQVGQVNELVREAIARRFDALPEELLANELFKEELSKLKEDILREVEKLYSTRPAPPAPPRK